MFLIFLGLGSVISKERQHQKARHHETDLGCVETALLPVMLSEFLQKKQALNYPIILSLNTGAGATSCNPGSGVLALAWGQASGVVSMESTMREMAPSPVTLQAVPKPSCAM